MSAAQAAPARETTTANTTATRQFTLSMLDLLFGLLATVMPPDGQGQEQFRGPPDRPLSQARRREPGGCVRFGGGNRRPASRASRLHARKKPSYRTFGGTGSKHAPGGRMPARRRGSGGGSAP